MSLEPPVMFICCLALCYALDFMFHEEWNHKTNLIAAAVPIFYFYCWP